MSDADKVRKQAKDELAADEAKAEAGKSAQQAEYAESNREFAEDEQLKNVKANVAQEAALQEAVDESREVEKGAKKDAKADERDAAKKDPEQHAPKPAAGERADGKDPHAAKDPHHGHGHPAGGPAH